MAASEYEITIGLGRAYISKIRKSNVLIIPTDRKPIEEGEILMLVDWLVDREAGKDGVGFSFQSRLRPDCRLELRYVKSGGKEANGKG